LALYTYLALSPAGKREKGTINAASENEAKAILRGREVYPLEIRPSASLELNLRRMLSLGREPRRSPAQLATFTRQFTTLLQATIPYDTALSMIINQSTDQALKNVLSEVRARVVEGASLADAFSAFPGYFPPMVVSMVRSGESSGSLVLIVNRLAEHYETLSRLRSRIGSALVYPLFMVIFGFGVVSFMITYIIPKIARLFENFGAVLPLPTRILIGLSEAFTGYWWLMLLVALVGGFALSRFLRTPAGAYLRDQVELALPGWGKLRRKIIVQRFSQTLATLLKSGVELKGAMQIATEVMENRLYVEAMDRVILDVQNRGIPLSVALRRVSYFPEDVCQMVAIGEETAALDEMLEHVSNRLSAEITATIEAVTALFEPVMILLMGLVVGFIVMSILLPMLQLNQLIR